MAGETDAKGQGAVKPCAVFDCMVFLQGAGRPASPARACFRLVDSEQITLFISEAIFTEVQDVLTRPKTQRRFPLLSPEWAKAFVQNVATKVVVIHDVPAVFTLSRDPKDEPYVNLAIAAQAHYLVSRDRDLLDLMQDAEFRGRFPNLIILDPVAFLQELSRVKSLQPSEQETTGKAPDMAGNA